MFNIDNKESYTAVQSQCCHRTKCNHKIQLRVLHSQLMKTQIHLYSNIQEHRWADDGGLMTLVSAEHDSIKLGKPTIVRHKASEVPLYNMNPRKL